jgi:hypothetical protein
MMHGQMTEEAHQNLIGSNAEESSAIEMIERSNPARLESFHLFACYS